MSTMSVMEDAIWRELRQKFWHFSKEMGLMPNIVLLPIKCHVEMRLNEVDEHGRKNRLMERLLVDGHGLKVMVCSDDTPITMLLDHERPHYYHPPINPAKVQ